jgi:hypothetical protein
MRKLLIIVVLIVGGIELGKLAYDSIERQLQEDINQLAGKRASQLDQ